MLLGGWAVYFTVQERWSAATGEDYFGSRDIDLGFHTPPGVSLDSLQQGNMPATLEFLESKGFARQGMYQLVRHHDWETNAVLAPQEVAALPGYAYYDIAVDLIASHQRKDLREIAGFQAFSEPLLAEAFAKPHHRTTIPIGQHDVWMPAPHLLAAMKLRSLPERQKGHKSIKDLCDLYAIIVASSDSPRTIRSRLHRILPDAQDWVQSALVSEFMTFTSGHLEVSQSTIQAALQQLL